MISETIIGLIGLIALLVILVSLVVLLTSLLHTFVVSPDGPPSASAGEWLAAFRAAALNNVWIQITTVGAFALLLGDFVPLLVLDVAGVVVGTVGVAGATAKLYWPDSGLTTLRGLDND